VAQTVNDLLRDLSAALSTPGRRWYLFGAQAAIIHGSARLSADVDVTVMMEPSDLDSVLQRLASHGIVPRSGDFRDIALKHRILLLWHERIGMPIDMVLGGPGIEEAFCARARNHDLGGTKIPIISAEDLLASKILAGRAKDIEDASAILKAGRDALDLDAARNVLRQLEQALDRCDLLPVLERLASHQEPVR
jgi:hypothetical protein